MFEAKSRVAESAGNQVRTSSAPNGPRGAVESELSELDATLEVAHNRLSVLVGRLEPVLRPTPPDAAGGNGGTGTGLAPMASALAIKIDSQKRTAGYLLTRIDELLDRIDL